MKRKPTEFRRVEFSALSIRWNDGELQEIPSRVLRANCPCATCKEARGDTSHAAPLTPKKSALKIIESTVEEETKLQKIWPVGNYALGIEWGDGHNTGIYTYDYLHELGSSERPESSPAVRDHLPR